MFRVCVCEGGGRGAGRAYAASQITLVFYEEA